jgi:hypothetical protein
MDLWVILFLFMKKKATKNILGRNGLSIFFLLIAIICLFAQSYTGWHEYNEFREEHHKPHIAYIKYFGTGHFLQATFENWESEFLQMALFVIFTIFLRQQGSSESKGFDEPALDDKELRPIKDSPWPVRKGGIWLGIYKYSLSIALLLLFLASFFLHWYGSWIDYNEKQLLENKPAVELVSYLDNNKLWFESFQNWQSEFLSVFAIIFLSVYLRQWGSSQSKPVNMPHDEQE